jgi:hypothetical protein
MSKMHLIAAAAALATAGAAQALTPAQVEAARAGGTLKEVRIAGASALRLSVAAYMKEICTDNGVGVAVPFDLHVYFFNTTAQNTDHRAYACTLGTPVGNFVKGTPVLVIKRDAGGSAQGVNPIATAALQTHILVNAASCATTINAAPSVDPSVANYTCASTESVLSDAGISDAEPAIFQATVNLPTGATALTTAQLSALNSGSLVQALFGVVVNKKAYRALQEAQGIIAPGGALVDVPADQATWTAATLATIPSLPLTFIRGALTGQVIGGSPNTTPKRGWNLVIPNAAYTLDGINFRPAVDANSVTKTMNICRRTEGSGTQALTAAFVANNPCNNTQGGFYTPAGVPGSSGNATTVAATVTNAAPNLVQEGTSAGQVEVNCLQETENTLGAPDNTAYAIGVLGREANPLRAGGDLGYRYVKIDGAAPVRSVAKAGDYPFVYEATMQWNNTTLSGQTDKLAFLGALRTGFGTPNALAAVDADTQQGVMSPPATYAGAYVDAVGNAALFGSRVTRVTGNSCGALRITK